MNYNAKYFINKFSAIPDDKWIVGIFVDNSGDKCCALGHCGASYTSGSKEANALSTLIFKTLGCSVAFINDGAYGVSVYEYVPPVTTNELLSLGDTPKERILTALELIEAGVSV